METAPLLGQIEALVPGSGIVKIELMCGFLDENGNSCTTWVAIDKDNYPKSWHQGVFWGKNKDGVPSQKPIAWRFINGF